MLLWLIVAGCVWRAEVNGGSNWMRELRRTRNERCMSFKKDQGQIQYHLSHHSWQAITSQGNWLGSCDGWQLSSSMGLVPLSQQCCLKTGPRAHWHRWWSSVLILNMWLTGTLPLSHRAKTPVQQNSDRMWDQPVLDMLVMRMADLHSQFAMLSVLWLEPHVCLHTSVSVHNDLITVSESSF